MAHCGAPGDEAMTTNSVAGSGATNGAIARPARPARPLWQGPVFLLGLTALLSVAAVSPFSIGTADDKLEHDLGTIRVALESPGVPSDEVIAIAENTLSHASS